MPRTSCRASGEVMRPVGRWSVRRALSAQLDPAAPSDRALPVAYTTPPRVTVARLTAPPAFRLTVPDASRPLQVVCVRLCPLTRLVVCVQVTSSTLPPGPCGPVAPVD